MNADNQAVECAVGPDVAPSEPAQTGVERRRKNVHPRAAVTHGAHSSALIAERRGAHLERLQADFPAADVTILGLQASRLAQLELVGEWLDGRGIIRNKRFGTIWPAADYWGKVASAFERAHERLEAQRREAGANGTTLADIEAELAGDDEDGESA